MGGVIEFELVRTVDAQIGEVFERLAQIDGYRDWMPKRGSLLRHTKQTSPGPVGVGTTYVDQMSVGTSPGEVIEFDNPTTLVFHWWDASSGGKVKVEGWPGYRLEASGPRTTIVHHHARMAAYGIHRLMTPLYRRMALRERTVVIEALQRSFARPA